MNLRENIVKTTINSVVFYISVGIRKAFCFWSKPRIFLSSTYLDLIDERRTVTALLRAAGFDVVRMEEGPELRGPPEIISWSKRQASRADICIFMLSYRRGSTDEDPNYRTTYSEHELTGAFFAFPICYFLNRPFYDERRLIQGCPTEDGSRKLQALVKMTRTGLEGSPDELRSLRHEIDRLKVEASAEDSAAVDGCQRCDDESSRAEELRLRFEYPYPDNIRAMQMKGLPPNPPRTDLERAEQFLMSGSAETGSIPTSEGDDYISMMQFFHRLILQCRIYRRVESVRRLAFYATWDSVIAADIVQRARFHRLVKSFLVVVAIALLLVILL